MPIEHEKEDGTKVQALLPEEVEAAKTEAVTAAMTEKETELAKIKEDLAAAQRVSVEKTDNFKKFRDLSVDDKKAYDANTLEMMRRADKLEDDLTKEREQRETRETSDRMRNKDNALRNFHGEKEEVKKTLEEKYALLTGMPETTPEEISARAQAAAQLAGISVESRPNPLYQSANGEAPVFKEKKEYTETPKGQEAADLVRQAMGLKK